MANKNDIVMLDSETTAITSNVKDNCEELYW